jgi:hypothetical protein
MLSTVHNAESREAGRQRAESREAAEITETC